MTNMKTLQGHAAEPIARKGRWTLVGFLCTLFVFYTVDRALLGILAVPIQDETGIDNVRFGILSAAVFWTYSVCVPFSGLAGDRFNRARLIGCAVIAWSLMTFLAGFATGFWSLLLLVSVAICAPQTMYGPAANALIAEFHDKTRTLALSCHQAAYYTGWFVSGAAVAGVVALFGNWRWAFHIFGLVGLVLGIAFLFWSRASQTSQTSPTSRTSQTLRASLRAFFGCRTALLVAACYVTEVFVGYGYSAWGPKFIAQKFNLSAAAAGTGVMFWHYAAAFAAILVAGALTDRFVRRWMRFRLFLSAAALVVSMPALVLFGMSGCLTVVWISAALLGAMLGVIGANQFTALFDVVPSESRSGSIGFLNVIAGLVGSLAPIALGALSQRFGVLGFELGFASMAAAQIIPFLALLAAARWTFGRDVLAGVRIASGFRSPKSE